MDQSINRRDFFRSFRNRFSGGQKQINTDLIRPPYNLDPDLFYQKCPKCPGHCSLACEEDIIRLAQDETPYLVFDKSGCTFCGDCAKACELNVLVAKGPATLTALANLNTNTCVAWQSTECTECYNACGEAKAILLYDKIRPQVDLEVCTGCGLCVSVCPSKSIQLQFSNRR